MFYLIFFLINAGFALVVANAAKEKGRSAVAFWCISFFFSFIIGIIIISVLENKSDDKREIEGEEKTVLKNNFLGKYLVFIVLSLAFNSALMWLALSGLSSIYSRMTEKVLVASSYLAVMGFAVVISSKSKGVDLSIPAIFGFGGMFFGVVSQSVGLIPAAILSIIICAAMGMIQGVIIEYVKVPAIMLTLVTGSFLASFGKIMLNGEIVGIEMVSFVKSPVFFTVSVLIVLSITIALMYTKIGTPKHKREENEKSSFIYAAAYMISAIFACIAGILFDFRLNAASPIMDKGWMLQIVIFLAIISSTRLAFNRWVSPVIVLAAAIILTYRTQAFAIVAMDVFVQDILTGLLTAGLIIVMFVGRKKEYKYSLDSF